MNWWKTLWCKMWHRGWYVFRTYWSEESESDAMVCIKCGRLFPLKSDPRFDKLLK